MLFHGRGIVNTVWYCFLRSSPALLVNPARRLCDEPLQDALLLQDPALPDVHDGISADGHGNPKLHHRQFNLLNTFYALIPPGMAN